MKSRNQRLLITLLAGWAAFAGLGVVLKQAIAAPKVTVAIDRSYCDPQAWDQVAERYTSIYQQHQKQQVQIEAVIFFSDLGEEKLATPPEPATVQQLNTYGRSDPERQQALIASLDSVELLTCAAASP